MKIQYKYVFRLCVVLALALLCSLTLNRYDISKENILMVFIVGVLLVAAVTRGYLYGVIASIISALCFNYLFINPNYDFHISDPGDVMLVVFFLITSLIACSLTDRLQKQMEIAKKNESISKQLFVLSKRLLNVSGIEQILYQGRLYIEESIHVKTAVTLQLKPESKNVILITGMNRALGTIEILDEKPITEDQMIIINAAANQLGNALERELTYQEQEKIKVAMEREHMLNSMLKSISHDLRTPLTGIMGASSLLLEKKDMNLEDMHLLSQDIYDQAKWLIQIVENILNMSKIENGLELNKNIEVVDDLIYEAIRHVPELDQRDFQLQLPSELLLINVDGKLMIQVLINILNNAIQYTKRGDRIIIVVESLQNDIRFTVKDSGSGIHPSVLESIFDEFVTYSGVSGDSHKGIGLGLAICKAIIQAHHGHIQAMNNPDQGASIIFTIPQAKEINI